MKILSDVCHDANWLFQLEGSPKKITTYSQFSNNRVRSKIHFQNSESVIMGLKIKAEETKAYKTYRNSPLGKALFDTIEELMEDGLLNHEQSIKLIKQFDVSLRKELRNACDNEISNFVIKANSLRSFRVLNGHHQVVLENVEVIRQVPIDVIQYHLRNSGKTTLNYSALNLKNPSEWMTWRRNNWLVGVPCIGKKIPKVVSMNIISTRSIIQNYSLTLPQTVLSNRNFKSFKLSTLHVRIADKKKISFFLGFTLLSCTLIEYAEDIRRYLH